MSNTRVTNREILDAIASQTQAMNALLTAITGIDKPAIVASEKASEKASVKPEKAPGKPEIVTLEFMPADKFPTWQDAEKLIVNSDKCHGIAYSGASKRKFIAGEKLSIRQCGKNPTGNGKFCTMHAEKHGEKFHAERAQFHANWQEIAGINSLKRKGGQ